MESDTVSMHSKMPLFGYFQLFQQIFMLHLNVVSLSGNGCGDGEGEPTVYNGPVQNKSYRNIREMREKKERERARKIEKWKFPVNRICYNNKTERKKK